MEAFQTEESMVRFLNEALISCEKCHLCNTVCPICDPRVTQGPYGINRSIYYGIKWRQFTEKLRDLVYSCTTCGKCVVKCKGVSRALPLVEIIEKARELLLVEKMMGPMPDQTAVLKNMHIRGNPWGNAPHERTDWAKGLDIPFAAKDSSVEILYFVGCASSYDPQAQKIAKSLTKILMRAGVNFGILQKEVCSGHEARRMGETGLFQFLSEENMALFEQAGIHHIVTGDPHSFYSFSNEYPFGENGPKIQHYTQFLNDLIEKGQLNLSTRLDEKVTYHDPCYLGRHSDVYDAPRKLIQHIPGVELVEMDRHREDSDCCGMGGGRMWMEPPKTLLSSQAIANRRVRQALDTGAKVLLTACPFCNITLNDAVKSLEEEEALKVMDITELLVSAL